MSEQTIDVELLNVTKEFAGRGSEAAVKAVDDISLRIHDGEFFALLGPSGCGKTTTLRMIAGFEHPTRGEILLRGKPVQGVPPFHRPVNTVFQDYALFPHMTALQNVMFGLEMENLPKQEAQERATQALNMVQLPGTAQRKPKELSGGQQQRVALARALVKNPTVLLLDEPLGALDLKLRKEMQYELKAMQANLGITFIYVTHDQEEALTMADRIAVMNEGKVLQVGQPEEIYEQPHTRFVADFIGETNFIAGILKERDENIGRVALTAGHVISAVLDAPNIPVDKEVTVAVRPERLGLVPATGELRHMKVMLNAAMPAAEQSLGDNGVMDAESLLQTMQESPDITVLLGRIKQSVYIGTDIRHVVTIGDDEADVVVRIQNFSRLLDRRFDEGEAIYIYWVNENARILRD